jgi:hypothetical protein
MPKPANHSGAAAVCIGGPGAAMRKVAETLAAHGFEVCPPEWPDSRCLTITSLPGTTCDVTVEDSGAVTWEYWRGASEAADPDRVAALALRLLTDGSEDLPPASAALTTTGYSLQGTVGRELEAKGMDVSLNVYADHLCFEVAAEIVVTNPARPERGRIRVGDEAGLVWETGRCGTDRTDPGAITGTIIAVLAQDIEDGYVRRGELARADSRRGNTR